MSRLTRVQQQEHTHERLLDAGRLVFLRRGFLAVTVEEIAAEAGYTRGAVYKHFGGKEGLWQAIIESRAEDLLLGLRAVLDLVTSHEELVAALNPSIVLTDADAARWTTVSVEFLAAIAGRPEHAAAVAALQRRHDHGVVALLERHCQRLRVRPAVPLAEFVVAWGALGGGLALLRAVDPTIDATAVAASVLAVLLPPTSAPSAVSASESRT